MKSGEPLFCHSGRKGNPAFAGGTLFYESAND